VQGPKLRPQPPEASLLNEPIAIACVGHIDLDQQRIVQAGATDGFKFSERHSSDAWIDRGLY
jgi:hypothetical protein